MPFLCHLTDCLLSFFGVNMELDLGRSWSMAPQWTQWFSFFPFFFLLSVKPWFFIFFIFIFYQLEANYFTILQWFLSYIDMNQPWIYMCSPSRSPLPPPHSGFLWDISESERERSEFQLQKVRKRAVGKGSGLLQSFTKDVWFLHFEIEA